MPVDPTTWPRCQTLPPPQPAVLVPPTSRLGRCSATMMEELAPLSLIAEVATLMAEQSEGSEQEAEDVDCGSAGHPAGQPTAFSSSLLVDRRGSWAVGGTLLGEEAEGDVRLSKSGHINRTKAYMARQRGSLELSKQLPRGGLRSTSMDA